MKKVLTLTLLAAFAFAPIASAQTTQNMPVTVYAIDATGSEQISLDPDASGQAITVPLNELGGTVPSDLQLAVEAGQLPSGDTVTLDRVTSDTMNAYLYVTYHHDPKNAEAVSGEYYVNALPSFDVMANGKTVTTVWLPVQTRPVISAQADAEVDPPSDAPAN